MGNTENQSIVIYKQKGENPFYNLDMIISVGYRVKSKTATQFRIWATNMLQGRLAFA